MSDHSIASIQDPGPLRAPRLRLIAGALTLIGLAVFVGLLFTDATRAWSSLLQGMLVPTFVGLGVLFYLSAHSAANARWHTPIRRLMEGLTTGLPLTALAFLAIAAFGGPYLYDFINQPAGSPDHQALFHVQGGTKSQMMTWTRWALTNAVFISLWWFLRDRLVGLSVRQDAVPGDIRPRLLPWSIAFLIIFAITFTFFVFDMLLSLHVNWFSTMWGVYCLTSAVQSFLCVLVLVMVWMRHGPMRGIIQEHTVHDVGTWMVGWSCFCAYIGFSQYMLIYYANLDEETYFYVIRQQHGYGLVYAIEAFIRWPLPFLALMSQSVRTKSWALAIIASIVLFGNWLDWSWIIMPAFDQNHFPSLGAILATLAVGAGFAGAFLLLALRFWGRHGLIAKGDPHLLPTVNAEHLH